MLLVNALRLHFNRSYAPEETRRLSRLVQMLIFILTGIEILRAFIYWLSDQITAVQQPTTAVFLITLILLPLISGVALWFVRNGRAIIAAHFYLISFNTLILFLLLITDNFNVLPYMLLVSSVAIAAFDSVRASIVYTFFTMASMIGYVLLFSDLPITAVIPFFLTHISVSLVTWLTANYLHQTLLRSDLLTVELKTQTEEAQRRAKQLQISAEVSQHSSQSLELGELLSSTVNLIRDQFGFYYVSIFNFNSETNTLDLTEATGDIGATLKKQQYTIPLETNAVIAWVGKNKKARIVRNVATDPNFMAEPLLSETRSELAMPLIVRGELLGVLDVQSDTLDAFRHEDINILQIMANQIATNLENARLFAQTEQQLNETERLYEFNQLLSTTMDPGEIFRRAARTISRDLPAIPTAATISTWDPELAILTAQAQYTGQVTADHKSRILITGDSYEIANFPALEALLTTGESITETTTAVYPLLPTDLPWQTAVCLHIPLIHGETTSGIIHLFREGETTKFTPEEIRLTRTLATQTAIALENALLASEARARVAQLSTLNRMSRILSLAPNLKEIFDGVRREILALVEATGMSIMLLTPDKKHLNWIYGFEYSQEVDLSKLPALPVSQGFSGHVVRTRELLHVNKDFNQLSDELQSFVVGAAASSWLGFPMIVANEIVGVLAVENEHDPDAFHQRDIDLLRTLVASVAIGIHNILQLERIRAARDTQAEQRLQLQTAAEVAATATTSLKLDELLDNTVTLIRERFNLYYVGLFLIDDQQMARLHAGTGEAGTAQIAAGHALGVGSQSLIGGATADGQPRITQDVTANPEWRPNPYLPETKSELALPLRVRGSNIGALTVQSTTPDAFSPELIATLQTMCDQVAVAIENVRLLMTSEAQTQAQRELNEISALMHRSADVEEILDIGLRALSERLDGASVTLHMGQHANNASSNGRS